MYEDSRRRNIRNLVALHSLHVMIILEPRISGDKADHVCRRIGFSLELRMNVLLWNSRGAGNPAFIRNVRDLLVLHKPTMWVVVEPLGELWKRSASRIYWPIGRWGLVVLGLAVGFFGYCLIFLSVQTFNCQATRAKGLAMVFGVLTAIYLFYS